jgi:hypothetical protein
MKVNQEFQMLRPNTKVYDRIDKDIENMIIENEANLERIERLLETSELGSETNRPLNSLKASVLMHNSVLEFYRIGNRSMKAAFRTARWCLWILGINAIAILIETLLKLIA